MRPVLIALFCLLFSFVVESAPPPINYAIDYYAVLEVPFTASQIDIESTWLRLRRRYHPDRNPNDAFATEHFMAVKEAYEILSNPALRSDYDNGRRSPSQSTGASINDDYRAHWIYEIRLSSQQGEKNPALIALTKTADTVLTIAQRARRRGQRERLALEFDSFCGPAWNEIVRSLNRTEDADQLAHDFHRLYWALAGLGSVLNRPSLFSFEQLPKIILKNAFFTARSPAVKASVAGSSLSQDLDPATVQQWLSFSTPPERIDFFIALSSYRLVNPRHNNSPVRDMQPDPKTLEALFLRTHNAATYQDYWRKTFSDNPAISEAAITGLIKTIQFIKNEKQKVIFVDSFSREIDKFIRSAWEQIQSSYLSTLEGHASVAVGDSLTELYNSLVSLRAIGFDDSIYSINELPALILHTAFLAAPTPNYRARLTLFSQSEDLTETKFKLWLVPFSWQEQQRIYISINQTAWGDPNAPININVRQYALERTITLSGRMRSAALRCRDFLVGR